jgi:PAS domain S-box-containing protein
MEPIERAKQEWETAVDALSQVVCLLDDRGVILRANRALERWALGRVTQVRGYPVHAVFHPACTVSDCPLERFWHQALEKCKRGISSVWEGKDQTLGRSLRVEVRPTARTVATASTPISQQKFVIGLSAASPTPAAAPTGERVAIRRTSLAVTVISDDTGDQQAEPAGDKLAEAHAQMLALVNQLRIGIVILDATGRIAFLNEPCQRLLGRQSADLLGQHWQHVLSIEPVDTDLHQVLSGLPLSQPAKCAVRLTVGNGTRYWVNIEAQPDSRNPRHTILYFYDVSEGCDLRQAFGQRSHFYELIGQSLPMWRVYRQIQEVAPVDTTVLIEGETGTGKELVARAIHFTSPRREQPFLVVQGVGLGSNLLESRLFGHKRGAFTGAVADQQGLFEAAHGGTLFLDEVGGMDLTVQTHLLRVLQEHEITRLGETQPRKVDMRILASTQQDLHDEVRQGRFRADLLYRLLVVQIAVPPLRQRSTDIPLLVQEFVAECSTRARKSVQGVSQEAMQRLCTYPWPGNVRELRNVIESAVIRCTGNVIQVMELPLELSQFSPSLVRLIIDQANEKDRLLAALEQTGGNRRQAARLLGISKSTLYRHFAQYGIS